VIDVEVALMRRSPAVLALKAVTQHEVSATQANDEARGAIVPQEVQHARHANGSTHDRQRVVVVPERHVEPGVEIMGVSMVVDGVGGSPVEEHEAPAGARDGHRGKKPIQEQDGEGKHVPVSTVSDDRTG
jgi:hypothetical protein